MAHFTFFTHKRTHHTHVTARRRGTGRIGHTLLTHSYLLSGADQPECTTCQDVKHILVECTAFNDTPNKYFIAFSVEELFEMVDVCNVLDFIKEIHVYKL